MTETSNQSNPLTSKQKNVRVSISLQALAGHIHDYLFLQAGEPVGFVLVVACDNIAHHVSNCEGEDVAELLRGTLEHHENGKADIPAHYNLDLKPGDASPKAE